MRIAHVPGIIAVAPHMCLLASAGARHHRVKAECPVDDAAHAPFGNTSDIDSWFPPQHQEHPQIQSKVVWERPVEGIIVSIKPNTNFHPIKQPMVQVEGWKFGNI